MLKLGMLMSDDQDLLEQVRQYCIHAEPNYGVLWFYFKNSILDNAFDIWENAKHEFENSLSISSSGSKTSGRDASAGGIDQQWMASRRLIRILKSGMKECRNLDEKLKIIYGFEQVLPPASAYL